MSVARMRVLIVYPVMYLYGGAELLVVRLANYLTKQGINNALLTISILPEIENDLIGTRVIRYLDVPREKGMGTSDLLKRLWCLNKGVRENLKHFDIINVHNYPSELAVYPYRKPVVWMCNEPPQVAVDVRLRNASRYSYKRLILQVFLAFDRHVVRNYVKNAVVADKFNETRFRKIYGFTPYIINYGIDYDFFALHSKNVRRKPTDGFRVLHVGMLTPLKNQMESIKAMEKLKDKIPHIKLILAGLGEGEYLRALGKYVEDHRLNKHVEITGHLNREEIRALYQTCNVLVHPIKSQGGWLSPFEALCSNLPIVVSREMTASDIVEREDLGVVTDDYADAILDIHQDPEKYERMAPRRAAWVRDNLSWDNFAEKMLRVFCRAMEKKYH